MSRTVLDTLEAAAQLFEREVVEWRHFRASNWSEGGGKEAASDAALLRALRDALSNPTDLALDCASYGYATSAPNGKCQCCPCSLARLVSEDVQEGT